MVDFSSIGYDVGSGATTQMAPQNGFGGGVATQAQANQFGASKPYDNDEGLLHTATNIVGDIAASPVDLVDTVASSIPGLSSAMGVQRGDFNQHVLDAIGSPGLQDWYDQNKGGIAVASGIAGVVGAEFLSGGLASVAAPLVGALTKASWATKALALDSEYNKAMTAVGIADATLAGKGLSGARLFTDAMGEAGVPALTNAGLDAGIANTGRNVLVTKAALLGTAKGVVHALRTEAVMATTLNQNDFLYSTSAGENIFNAALGAGVGGLVSGVMAKYAIRKFANSDVIRRLNSGALDPNGLAAARTSAPVMPEAGTPFAKKVAGFDLGTMQGARTDKIVSLMSDAKAVVPNGVDVRSFERQGTQLLKQAQDETQKVTVKGIPGIDGTGFSTAAAGYGNHIEMAVAKDPSFLLGTEAMGGATADLPIGKIHSEFTDGVQSKLVDVQALLSDPKTTGDVRNMALAKLETLNFQNRLVPVPVINGEATTMSQAAVFDEWHEPQIAKTQEVTQAGPVTTYDATDFGKTRGVALDSTGKIIFNDATRTVNNASQSDLLNLYRLGGEHLRSLVGDPKAVMDIPSNYNWFHLDMGEALAKANPQATINWPAGLTRETAQVESFAQKVDALKNRAQLTGDQAAAQRVRFNLPQLTGYEAGMLGSSDTPADVILRGAIQSGGGDTIRGMSLPDVLAGFDQQRQINGLQGRVNTSNDSLTGNMFNFLRDDAGNPVKPILLLKRPFMQEDFTPNNLAERLAINKGQRVTYLAGPQAAPMTKMLQTAISSSPDTTLAADIGSLSDTQIASSLVPGAANQASSTPFGRLINGATTAEWRARDTPALLAAKRLGESIDRLSQAQMKQVFQGALGDQLVTINQPRNRASRYMLSVFHDQGQGWDFVPPKVNSSGLDLSGMKTQLADGTDGYHFPLEDTVNNQTRFKAIHGRDMTKGDVLMTPDGKPILLDQMAMDFQNSFNQGISDPLRLEKNTLNEAAGLPTISSKPFYIPPPNPEGKFIGFTFDPLGKVVPGGTIMGSTEKEFNELVQKFGKDPTHPMTQDGNIFRPQEDVADYASLMDKAQMDMMSPGRTYIQGGKSSKGGLLSAQINLGALDDSLASMRNEYLQHGRDVLQFNMDDQLKAAKMKSLTSAPAQAQGKQAFGIKQGGKNIFDYYSEALTGRSPLSSEKSALGRIQAQLESDGNALLTSTINSGPAQLAKQASAKVWATARDWTANVNPWGGGDVQRDAFKALTDKLGPNMPFNTVADMMDAQGVGKAPASLKSIAAGTSKFEATWVLRVAEPMQAVMNLTGIPNAAPAVIRNLTQRTGESVEDYAARIGHAADIFSTPDGRQFGTLNMAKMMQTGFQRAWSGQADADWARLANKGMLSQEVAEFQKAFNAADASRTGWETFMHGNPNATSKFAQKGVLGWASLLTDKSEDYSRAWAHMIGDEVAKFAGVTEEAARDNFAHDIANKMIANYNPGNKPAMFQGVVGTPIGLFQGFIWAYYQRMFRYLETGDKIALATQYATQAASFGLKTVPGFNEVNNMYFQHSNGHNSPYDAITERFGAGASDALMGGVWGNLPRLFGGKAVDLASRGDTSFRTPVLTPPAIFSTMSKIKQGIGAGIGLFSGKNPHFNGQQLAEIVSNTLPNRPIAGIVEQLGAGGADTDASGQLVSQSHDWMDVAARILGTRTMTQSNDLTAFYANKQMTEIRAQQMETLNANARGLIRSGNTNDLQGMFQTYVNNGGDPRQYKSWVQRNMVAATQTRSQRQLHDLGHNPDNQDAVDRMLSQSTGISAEANQPDPAQTMATKDSLMNQQPMNSASQDPTLPYGDPSTGFSSP